MAPLPHPASDAKQWRRASREAAKQAVAEAKQRIRSCQANIQISKQLIEYCKAEIASLKLKR